jgi:hypothetical protein
VIILENELKIPLLCDLSEGLTGNPDSVFDENVEDILFKSRLETCND